MYNKESIIDISWPICKGMVEYKDNAVLNIETVKNFANDGVYQTQFTMSSHTGTHIDAPYHMLAQGKRSESLEPIIGPCKILDLSAVKEAITQDDLQRHEITAGDILLLKTRNSFMSATGFFNYDFIYLADSGAHYLAQHKVRAVGIDYLGIERKQEGHPTHKALLGAGISVIEGLRLELAVVEEPYTLVCLPLKMFDLEAAPARALLLKRF